MAHIDYGKILGTGSPSALKAGLAGDMLQIWIEESEGDLKQLISQIRNVKEIRKQNNFYRVRATNGEAVALKS